MHFCIAEPSGTLHVHAGWGPRGRVGEHDREADQRGEHPSHDPWGRQLAVEASLAFALMDRRLR